MLHDLDGSDHIDRGGSQAQGALVSGHKAPSGDGRLDLGLLSHELLQLANRCAQISSHPPSASEWLPLPLLARSLAEERNIRSGMPGMQCTKDAGWFMLLELYLAAQHGSEVCTTSLCYGVEVPISTGLRCIDRLVEFGYVTRSVDNDDGRRTMVALTGFGKNTLDLCLNRILQSRLRS